MQEVQSQAKAKAEKAAESVKQEVERVKEDAKEAAVQVAKKAATKAAEEEKEKGEKAVQEEQENAKKEVAEVQATADKDVEAMKKSLEDKDKELAEARGKLEAMEGWIKQDHANRESAMKEFFPSAEVAQTQNSNEHSSVWYPLLIVTNLMLMGLAYYYFVQSRRKQYLEVAFLEEF